MACDKICGSFAWVACEPQPAFARTEHEDFVSPPGRLCLCLLTAGTGNVLLGLKVGEQMQQRVREIATRTGHNGSVV